MLYFFNENISITMEMVNSKHDKIKYNKIKEKNRTKVGHGRTTEGKETQE